MDTLPCCQWSFTYLHTREQDITIKHNVKAQYNIIYVYISSQLLILTRLLYQNFLNLDLVNMMSWWLCLRIFTSLRLWDSDGFHVVLVMVTKYETKRNFKNLFIIFTTKLPSSMQHVYRRVQKSQGASNSVVGAYIWNMGFKMIEHS